MAASNLELSRAGGRRNHGTGSLILSSDLNEMGDIGLRTLCQVLALLFYDSANGFPQTGFPRDAANEHCKVSATGDLSYSISSGWGLYYDATGIGTEEYAPSSYRPIVLESALEGTLAPHDPTLPRIDVVAIAPAWATDLEASRYVKNPSTGERSSSSIAARKRFSAAVQVVTGAPSTAPVAPSVPAGYVEIARAAVPAASGAAVWYDHRPALQLGQYFSGLPGLAPTDFVLGTADLAVSASSPAAMSVVVAEGRALINGLSRTYQRQTLAIAAADATNPRIDLVRANESGTVTVVTGTPAASPVAPSVGTAAVGLAWVRVEAAATTIVAGKITDRRLRAPTSELVIELGTPVSGGGGDYWEVPIELLTPGGADYAGPFGEGDTRFVATLWDHAVDGGALSATHPRALADFTEEPNGGSAAPHSAADNVALWFKPTTASADAYCLGGAPVIEGPLIFWMPSQSGSLLIERPNGSLLGKTFYLAVRPVNRPGGCTALTTITFA